MNRDHQSINVPDIVVLKTFTLVIPLLASLTEAQVTNTQMSITLLSKWFLFSAVGLRVLVTGLRNISWLNIGFGVLAIFASFMASWKFPVAIIACAWFFVLSIRHFRNRPYTFNEWMELLTDAVVLLALGGYILFDARQYF